MNFLNHSFKIGRLFEINIRIHILFVIWIAFRAFDSGAQWQSELTFLAMLFGIVLLHEFGHCFGARSVGGDAENILMWPLGGLAYAHAPMRPWPQFVTVAAGPAVNVVFCIITAAVIFASTGGRVLPNINPVNFHLIFLGTGPITDPGWWFTYALTFYHVNLFLLAFNLLPIYPLDGGQLFHAIIWPFVGLQRASIIACQVGIVGCVLFGLWGLSGGPRMLMFIAIFGGFTCWQRLQAARMGWLIEDSPHQSFGPSYNPRPWYQRIFKTGSRRRSPSSPLEHPNPNPGAWQRKQAQGEKVEADLDRILKKVHEHGIESLSYVDRQKLKRITRQRQEEENEFQRNNTL